MAFVGSIVLDFNGIVLYCGVLFILMIAKTLGNSYNANT